MRCSVKAGYSHRTLCAMNPLTPHGTAPHQVVPNRHHEGGMVALGEVAHHVGDLRLHASMQACVRGGLGASRCTGLELE